jgi:hypothetical protein
MRAPIQSNREAAQTMRAVLDRNNPAEVATLLAGLSAIKGRKVARRDLEFFIRQHGRAAK